MRIWDSHEILARNVSGPARILRRDETGCVVKFDPPHPLRVPGAARLRPYIHQSARSRTAPGRIASKPRSSSGGGPGSGSGSGSGSVGVVVDAGSTGSGFGRKSISH